MYLPADQALRPLLDVIRIDANLTGTKEGCRSGECGACMVLVADSGGMRGVNTCIHAAAQVQGKQVFTIEGVQGADSLHPVQQGMIDARAAQCGFCTPGMVIAQMAARIAAVTGADAADIDVEAALAGNLCRCTGYRPIIDAARSCMTFPLSGIELGVFPDEPATPLLYRGQSTTVHAPIDLPSLLALRRRMPDAVLLAGGTDLMTGWRRSARYPTRILMLGQVSALARLERSDSALIIGAGVSVVRVVQCLLAEWPEAAGYLRRFGSPAINAVATIAGNLQTASPVGDLAPLLLALGAWLVVESSSDRRQIDLQNHFAGSRCTGLAADEVITSVHIPRRPTGFRLFAYKTAKRFDQDIAAVSLAASFIDDGGVMRRVVIAAGGMANRPVRASAVESAFEDQPLDDSTIERAVAALPEDFIPIDDVRGSAAYRMLVTGNLLRKMQLEYAGVRLTSVRQRQVDDAL